MPIPSYDHKDERIKVFHERSEEYDAWFDQHPVLFRNELKALRPLWPEEGRGLEIGLGRARFSVPLGIREGVEPAEAMARIAEEKRILVHRGVAEELPLQDESFDKILMVTTVCFLMDPEKAFQEAWRVLRERGVILIGLLDKTSSYGERLLEKQDESPFYRDATFHSAQEVAELLKKCGFRDPVFRQTLFDQDDPIEEEAEEGHGKGGFVATRAVNG